MKRHYQPPETLVLDIETPELLAGSDGFKTDPENNGQTNYGQTDIEENNDVTFD